MIDRRVALVDAAEEVVHLAAVVLDGREGEHSGEGENGLGRERQRHGDGALRPGVGAADGDGVQADVERRVGEDAAEVRRGEVDVQQEPWEARLVEVLRDEHLEDLRGDAVDEERDVVDVGEGDGAERGQHRKPRHVEVAVEAVAGHAQDDVLVALGVKDELQSDLGAARVPQPKVLNRPVACR